MAAALHGAGCDYMVFGGVAIIARGVPRHTDDVDATVWAESLQLAPLLEHLSACEIRPRIDDAAAFARENQVLLLRHQPSDIAIDLTFAWLPFEKEALGRAEVMDLGGVRVPVATPEDLVIYKAVAWRDRDRADIERLMAIWGTRMDLARIRRIVGEFAQALDEPERLKELEPMLTSPPGKRPKRPRKT
jgi:hypothetical protein